MSEREKKKSSVRGGGGVEVGLFGYTEFFFRLAFFFSCILSVFFFPLLNDTMLMMVAMRWSEKYRKRSVIFKPCGRLSESGVEYTHRHLSHLKLYHLKHHECFMYYHDFFLASPSMDITWRKYTCVQVLFIISQLNS